jgi:hypothetical protein
MEVGKAHRSKALMPPEASQPFRKVSRDGLRMLATRKSFTIYSQEQDRHGRALRRMEI